MQSISRYGLGTDRALAETAEPSVFEKGEPIKIIVSCLMLGLRITAGLFALDVYLNHTLYQTYDNLDGYLYSVPVKGGTAEGISFDEILPLMLDIDRLEIEYQSGTERFERANLAEYLSCYYLFKQEAGFGAAIENRELPHVARIEVFGEALESETLAIWLSWEGVDALKREIERFAGLHNVAVTAVEVPQIESKLISLVRAGGDLPDAVMVQADYLPSLTGAKALQNLDYVQNLDILAGKGLSSFTLDNKLWAVPFYCDTQLVFYNPGLVDGPVKRDWDLAGLEDLALAIKDKDIIPLCWNAYSAYWLLPFQIGFGKQGLTGEMGLSLVNDDPTREALDYLLSLQQRGLLQAMERDAMIGFFIAGKAGIILSGSYSIPGFKALGINFKAVTYPFCRETGRYVSPLLDYKGFAVTRQTRHPVLARRLIQFLTGTGVAQRFTAPFFKLPANKGTWPLLQENNAYFKVLQDSYEIGTVIPPTESYTIYKNTMWKLLRFIFAGEMSVAETLETGQAVIDEKIYQNTLR